MKIDNDNMRSKSPESDGLNRKSSTESYDACMTLAEAIKNKKVKIGFRKFLESEFSVENLDFWLAVERYRKIADKELRKTIANEIYEEYVSPTSPSQVNLDHRTRQEIVERMSEDALKDCDTFDEAQRYVFCIMENDSFARFVRSTYYDICSQSGRRSPRKFLQNFMQSSRRRSSAPNLRNGKRLSESEVILNTRST